LAKSSFNLEKSGNVRAKEYFFSGAVSGADFGKTGTLGNFIFCNFSQVSQKTFCKITQSPFAPRLIHRKRWLPRNFSAEKDF
jgi:hypothetical protein